MLMFTNIYDRKSNAPEFECRGARIVDVAGNDRHGVKT